MTPNMLYLPILLPAFLAVVFLAIPSRVRMVREVLATLGAVPGPGLVTVLTSIKVTHRPSCACGWEAATPYSSSEVAYAAWKAHVERDEGSHA